MKLLLFSDLHNDSARCQKIVELSQQADITIGAGDFACQRDGLERCFKQLSGIKTPFIIVPGNNEDETQLKNLVQFQPHIHLLHGTGISLFNVDFFGVGGGIPVTPFGEWSYDLTEKQAEDLLEKCPKQGVLITHSPPRDCLDTTSSGQAVGSQAIRRCILKKAPQINVCGHIHHSAGQTRRLGQTTVINAGPKGMIHELGE